MRSGAHQRKELKRLGRHIARAAIGNEWPYGGA
jgi:hypothetical protein